MSTRRKPPAVEFSCRGDQLRRDDAPPRKHREIRVERPSRYPALYFLCLQLRSLRAPAWLLVSTRCQGGFWLGSPQGDRPQRIGRFAALISKQIVNAKPLCLGGRFGPSSNGLANLGGDCRSYVRPDGRIAIDKAGLGAAGGSYQAKDVFRTSADYASNLSAEGTTDGGTGSRFFRLVSAKERLWRRAFLREGKQVLAISALAKLFSELFNLRSRYPPGPEGDFLRGGYAKALARFQCAHEFGRLQQRVRRAGVQPGEAAPQAFDAAIAPRSR